MKRLSTFVLLAALWGCISTFALRPVSEDNVKFQLHSGPTSLSAPEVSPLTASSFFNFSSLKKSPFAAASDGIKEGNYVMTYKSLNTTYFPSGGSGVSISAKEGSSDTYLINDFYGTGYNPIEVNVDFSSGTFTIASQQLTTDSSIGRIDLALCTSSATPDYTTPLQGTINDDGTLSITSWWGLFVNDESSQYNGYPVGFYYGTVLTPANATMTATPANGSAASTYGVYISESQNVISVLNFANYGQTVNIVVNSDRSGSIAKQVAYIHATQGDVYTAAYTSAGGETININETIEVNKATDLRTITWNNWTIYNSNGYFNLWSEGKIVTDFDIIYPSVSDSLDGSGTEEDPYQIKSLADINYLSALCQSDATAGKYYALTADIDLTGYKFSPIGSYDHPFAGELDGNDHIISNLTIDGTSSGYAALFARAAKTASINNITLASPTISGNGRFTAGIVAYSEGVVSGCRLTSATIGSNYAYVGGIAAYATIVIDCSVATSQIVGLGGYVGGLVATLKGDIAYCEANDVFVVAGASNSAAPSGGLVASAQEGSSVADSHFAGMVSGNASTSVGQTLGGIAGQAYKSSIQRCFAVADIVGYTSDAITGGLVGSFSGSIADCYSAGRVAAASSAKTGGLVGSIDTTVESTLTSSYTSAAVSALTSSYDTATGCRELVGNYAEANATYTNLYFDNQMTSDIGSAANSLSTSQFVAGTALTGFDAATWTFSKGFYPRLTDQAATDAAQLGATSLDFNTGDNLLKISDNTTINTFANVVPALINNSSFSTIGHGASIVMNNSEGTSYTIKLNGSYATDTLAVFKGNVQYLMYIIKTAPKIFDGEGTADSPYLIKTKDDLVNLAQITSVSNRPFTGEYFLMTNDIDMTGVTDFPGIGCKAFSSAVSFGGIFDGGGHTIHNLVLSDIVWDTAPADPANSWTDGVYSSTNQPASVALFGIIAANAKVKNLTIASDCQFDGGLYVAAIAVTNNGTIENCRNFARIRSIKNYAAGIVVTNYGTVSSCLNAGAVLVNGSYASGIVCNNAGVIANVMNIGDISATTLASKSDDSQFRYVAGIVAYSQGRKISNTINAATIYSAKGECGGIAGYYPSYGTGTGYNELANVINYGIVNGATTTSTGAIVGSGATTGSVTNVFWDHQILPIMADANAAHDGMTGITTSALTSGQPLDGFDSDTWTFTAGAYPVLKEFASEQAVIDASRAVVTFADGETSKNVISNATLAAADGLTWKLASATDFSIDGSTLKAPATPTTKVSDVLTASIGSFTKSITIYASPQLSLAGSGLKDDPYQVASVDDWTTLANYVINTGLDMAGDYVAITNDIDFNGKTFTPIGTTTEIWNGNLLGNGHTLANITYTFTYSKGKVGSIRALGPQGSISDLSISGTFTSATATYAAVFVGEMSGTIQNCVNLANGNFSKSYFGGFAALAHSGAQFIDCVNQGTLTGTGSVSNAGGIVAQSDGPVTYIRCANKGGLIGTSTYYAGIVATSMPSTFIECYNSADISNTVSFCAGLVAYNNSNTTYKDYSYTFDHCYNTGNISAKGNAAGLGASAATSNCSMTAIGCYNTGTITASTTTGTAAGLFVKSTPNATLTDCWNSGNVTSAKSYGAGLIGTSATTTNLTNCHNTGNIECTAAIAGGLIAQVGATTVITDCYNTGNVTTGTYYAGGICGHTTATNIEVKNCYNTGNITSGTSRAGGIFGNGISNAIKITDCANFGDVKSANTTKSTSSTDGATNANGQAVGGIAGYSAATITRCYNVGSVSGANYVGGLVGHPYTTKSTATTQIQLHIADSYNAGAVNATDATSGGAIVGCDAEVNNDTKDLTWADDTSVTNTYYLDGLSNSTLTPAGTKLSVAQLAGKDLGSGWVTADDYCFPILTSLTELNEARVNAAAVVLADDDTEARVTTPFHVGNPDGVTWTASLSGVYVDGNSVLLPDGVHTCSLTLTATAGDYSKSTTLYLDSVTSIDQINADNDLTVESEIFFNLSGQQVSPQSVDNGSPYIVVRTYSDGSSRAFKIKR